MQGLKQRYVCHASMRVEYRALCNHWKESKKSDKWKKLYSLNVQSISTLQSSLISHSILCACVQITVRPLD